MRCALLIVAVVASGADLKVDHVTVAGSDLDKLRAMFAEAGIETVFGGNHANGQTQMALASFGDGSYLELIAPQPGADVTPHYWGVFMKANAGPCAWAIRSSDIAADTAPLKSAGIEVRSQRNGRTKPDGVELKWETADIGPGSPGSFFPFMIHDETPRERRVGGPMPNKIDGVTQVIVAVRDLKAAVAGYRAAYGLAEPAIRHDKNLGGELAVFAGSPVALESGGKWISDRLKQFGEAPCAFILISYLRGAPTPGEIREIGHVRWLDLGGMRIGVLTNIAR
jgi:Glyoxalase-like domain